MMKQQYLTWGIIIICRYLWPIGNTVVVLIIGAIWWSCNTSKETSATPANGITGETPRAIPVETYLLKKVRVVDVISATGTVFPLHDAIISSQTQGTVQELFVEIGDQVVKGEPLAQIENELKRHALEQAEAKLQEAKALFEKASRDFARNKKLHEQDDISDYVFDSARLQKESADALHRGAVAHLKIAQRRLSDTTIRSPLSGIVADVPIEMGSTLRQGLAVARIVDISSVKIKFGVPQKDISKAKEGLSARVSVDALPDVIFDGTLIAIGPQADLASRTFPVEILVANPSLRLRGGMIAQAEVEGESSTEQTLVPKSALLERSGETLMFVIENGVAKRRVARLGQQRGEKIVLMRGGMAGEEVVISGQDDLSDGSVVQVTRQHL